MLQLVCQLVEHFSGLVFEVSHFEELEDFFFRLGNVYHGGCHAILDFFAFVLVQHIHNLFEVILFLFNHVGYLAHIRLTILHHLLHLICTSLLSKELMLGMRFNCDLGLVWSEGGNKFMRVTKDHLLALKVVAILCHH